MLHLKVLAYSLLTVTQPEGYTPPQQNLFEWALSHFRQGGWGMWPILTCLVIMLWIVTDRTTTLFGTASLNKDAFSRGLKKYIYAGDLDKAISFVESQKRTPLTAVILAGLHNVPKREEDVQSAMDEAALRENPRIEKRTGYLAMIGNAAMLCGLLGTVSGLIQCFEAVAKGDPSKKAEVLAAGISEAMNCTAFGLVTAIPSLVLFSLMMGRTQHMLDDVNETSVGIMNLILANKDKIRMPGKSSGHREE